MTDRRRSTVIVQLGRLVLAGGLAGALAGFLWGGVGGRIAMRIVFLTSNSPVDGLQSDDGFEIGRLSTETFFLVTATTFIGAFLGPIAALLRKAMRNRTAVAASAFAVASGALVGSVIVHSDGIDFRLLDPLPLTVGLFVLIPAAAGATGVMLVDWFMRPVGWITRIPGPLAVVLAVLGAIPIVFITESVVRNLMSLIVVATCGLLGWGIAAIASPDADGPRIGRAAHWAVWVLLISGTALGIVGLAQDIAALR